MKHAILSLPVLLLVAGPASAQFQESFEAPPGAGYTLVPQFDDGSFDFFDRFPAPDNSNAARDDFQDGFDGSFAIFGQDIDDGGVQTSTGIVTIPAIDISTFATPVVGLSLGALDSEPNFDNYEAADGDGIEIYATVDGGARTLIGAFAPPALGGGGNPDAGDLYEDTDFDGVGDGTRLTTTLADFFYGVSTGNSLTLEIETTSSDSFEPIVLDNVRVGHNIPVELIAFDAQVSGRDVLLRWETASETNNAGFEVQMLWGETWNALGFVEGHGTTTEAQQYSYSTELLPGTYSFRLKQIDFDGQFEYFGNVEATVGTPSTHLLSAVYPNPFNPQASFDLAVAQTQHVSVELFNVLGQRVATLFDATMEADANQTFTIDGAGLATGPYVVRVTGERFAESRTVTLLK